MGRRRRTGLTAADKAELWRRWRQGHSVSDIARALACTPPAIHRIAALHGGITPTVRRRSTRVLSLAEREELSRGLAAGESLRCVARRLGRAPSTLSRELHRHARGCRDGYRATTADQRAWQNARRPKPCRLVQYPR
ncbi:helix-turn-helix domain-containing protein, partial [Methylonatrum kenyense]|uniref:helix-turn-helix domain-containing protein n=1 Tax=Methylonatrum kenyense TaxID=455253 RepID=UPI003D0CEA3C